MGFGDLKSDVGVTALNEYLADKSYIEGYRPSQADAVVFQALSGPPAAGSVNALRWYNQVNSYGDAISSLPGVPRALAEYGPPGAAAAAAAGDDDDFELFGSDEEEEESEEAAKIRQERIDMYNAKKVGKKVVIAKSNIILDVKPWDDETDMVVVERLVRSIEADGLLWGASKLVPLAYGIKKLQICCVVEDDKVGTDFLEEEITKFEDHIQSMDIAAFNKI